ncbi:MAG: hypothetical protein KAH38_07175 [Candidatus Hydrogenedentes bacterium]|nr:hypothetical protein [Candidatus Hydrogenedentota bacterium]
MTRYTKLYSISRVLEIFIGLYFLVGALPKGLDIDKFAVQIAAYKVILSPNLLLLTALFTLFVEVALGFMMILGVRLWGLVMLIMQGMLLFFSVLIIYAWVVHGLEDCGCFPFFKMSPQLSLAKNGFLVSSGIFIFWTHRKNTSCSEDSKRKGTVNIFSRLAPSALKILVAVLVASAATAYAYRDIEWSSFQSNDDDIAADELSYAQFKLYLSEGYFDLGSGFYLVPIMSMSCDECMEMVSEINELWHIPDMSPIIALCYEDVLGDMDIFRGNTDPIFPMYSLGNRALLYYALIGEESFRLSLIHNGNLVKAWDGYVPPYEEILDTVATVPGR